jgi:hypothetical protein
MRAALRGEPVAAREPGFFARSFLRLRAWLARRAAAAPRRPMRALPPARPLPQPARPLAKPPRPPGWFARLRARLAHLGARLAVASRLSAIIGRRQAEYLGHMMDLFREGDLEEALRHAIPIDAMPGAGPPSAPSLTVPTPRVDLRIALAARGRSPSALHLDNSFLDEIRALYRAAFDRLVREGRIEEAAFVLVELLHADAEAVTFLESHGKLALAAEIAESRGLAPALVVRQWFLAGDAPRAIAIARRHGVMADALVRVEKSHPQIAAKLRLAWADVLAQGGDYAAAVDVAWPVEDGRPLARAWIDRAIDVGGTDAARMLARKLALDPQTFAEVKPRAQALCAGESDEDAPARLAFARALAAGPRTPAAAALGRAALRAVVRDAGAGRVEPAAIELGSLLVAVDDAPLGADLPTLLQPAARTPLASAAAPATITLGPLDAGTMPILDAALLPDGRSLVALGEAGARLLTPDGRSIAHFDQPAHALAISDRGDRAVLIAPRGDVKRLAQVDLVSRRVAPWCEARLDGFAPDHDGSMWFASHGDEVFAIDLLARRFEALWRVSAVGGPVLAIARGPKTLSFVAGARTPERWLFELPAITLRDRAPVRQGADDLTMLPLLSCAADGSVATILRDHPRARLVVSHAKSMVTEHLEAGGVARPPTMVSEWIAYTILGPNGAASVRLVDAHARRVRRAYDLARATNVSLRFSSGALVIADDRGRLLAVELGFGALRRNLRL